MKKEPVILFDGVCNLCNSAVQFIIERDKKSVIKFAPLQSETGRKLLQGFNRQEDEPSSIVFIEDERMYTQSTAALRLCKYLTAPWPLLYGFIIVPAFIRDGIYGWIAKNRYRWFGKKMNVCCQSPVCWTGFCDSLHLQ